MDKINRVKELIDKLNEASVAYYKYDNPIMTDKEYDDLYDELTTLEKETGLVMSNSPTQKVQGFLIDGLKKSKHSKPMLSAQKTKLQSDIEKFVGDNKFYCSYKLDGLTLVVTYKNGKLFQVVTRGDGISGEDVTDQAKMITNLPLNIPFTENLELRGECVISWNNFRKINESLKEPYSHPRNLAAGSIRQLDTNIVKQRNLEFVVFECITPLNSNSKWETLKSIGDLGFNVVCVAEGSVNDCSEGMQPEWYPYPVDGLIFELDNIEYSNSLGSTSHHENCRIALKWKDDTYETILRDIEWNTTRTGLINPVAIFNEVDLGGALTTRATLHNISIIENLQLGIGDTITVYRSNMVIPKVHNNLTKSNSYKIPILCPSCGSHTVIYNENGSKTLHCTNPNCSAKLLDKFVHFVSKSAMNIEGLSEATIKKFINNGWIKCFADIYSLDKYKNEIINTDGFGEKSWNNLWMSIQNSRNVKLENFIVALGIPNVGKTASKTISKYFNSNWEKFNKAIVENFNFNVLDDFGEVLNFSIHNWHLTYEYIHCLSLIPIIHFITTENNEKKDNIFNSKTIVVTGTLQNFTRTSIQEKLEELGAKVSGSVSKNTSYVLAGENAGSKLSKAKELNVQIISEEEFLNLLKNK